MLKSSALSQIPIEELRLEIRSRQRRLPALQRRRDRIATKLARIDHEIALLSGDTARSERRRGGAQKGTLAAYLQRALSGKTMSVGEAAEAVKALGYKSNASNFRLMVNAALLRKGGPFKRIGRGRYTAK